MSSHSTYKLPVKGMAFMAFRGWITRQYPELVQGVEQLPVTTGIKKIAERTGFREIDGNEVVEHTLLELYNHINRKYPKL